MANTTNNLQIKGQESVKNLKTNVLDVSRDLQQRIAEIKRHAFSLSDAINKRRVEFAKAAEPEIEETVSLDNVTEVVEQPKTVENNQAVIENEKEDIQPSDGAEVTEPLENFKNISEPVVKEEKPKTQVVTTIENGREVKTYTDDKGNVKVRKFLDLSNATAKRSATTQNGARKTDGGVARNGQQRQDARRQNGSQTQFQNKDQQSDNRRGSAQKTAQKRFAAAPIVDIPQSGPQKSQK